MQPDIVLIMLSVIYGLCIFIAYRLDRANTKDVFSATKVIVYFATIEFLVMFWFSLREHSIQKVIFAAISPSYHRIELVYGAYCLSVVSFLFAICGSMIGSRKINNCADFFERRILNSRYVGRRNSFKVGGLLTLIAIPVYIVFIEKMGGISSLWTQIYLRTTLAAGLGYYQIFYTSLLFIGGVLVLSVLFQQQKWVFAGLAFLFFAIIFASTGQRAPVATFVFALLLSWHYNVEKINRLFSITRLLIFIGLVSFMFIFVQYRVGADSVEQDRQSISEFIEEFEVDVISRLGIIERQVVVLGYFANHDVWYGRSYLGLLEAYRPRSTNSSKAPVDTGIYLKALADGMEVYPPMPVEELQPTSWPEGNLAGFMNFHIVGLILLPLISGWIIGSFYRNTIIYSGALGPVIVYSLFAYMAPPSLSPFGIVQIFIKLGPFVILGCMFKYFYNKSFN